MIAESRHAVRGGSRGGSGCDLDLGHLLHASGAHVAADAAAVLIDRRLLDIGPEQALGLALGEANIVAAHRPLATYITFRHNFTLPDAATGVQIKSDRMVAPTFNIIKNNPQL